MIIHFNTEKRKTQKGKKEYWIRGRLVCPLTVGRPAVILVGNNICRTLPVLALHKETAVREDILRTGSGYFSENL